MSEHIRPDDLEAYVLGALGPEAALELERHAVSCATCSAQLAAEARVEVALYAALGDGREAQCPACHRATTAPRCDHCGAARAPHGYEIELVLAQNIHGRVYRAIAPDGARVALKELVFTQVPDVRVIEAFEREGRVLRELDHPRIPAYVDGFVDGEGVHTRFYLAQTYVEGDTLAELLTSHRFTEAEVRALATQILEVLVYLQELSPSVIHRDLKPSNLVRRPDGEVVLVDFGAARDRGATAVTTFAGTFGYAPTEQLVGLVDNTTDTYALGMTLIELLTRVQPGAAPHTPALLRRASTSAVLTRWLTRLTAARPEDRFPSARAALTALRAPAVTPARRWAPLALAALAAAVPGALVWVASEGTVGAPAQVLEAPAVPVETSAGAARVSPPVDTAAHGGTPPSPSARTSSTADTPAAKSPAAAVRTASRAAGGPSPTPARPQPRASAFAGDARLAGAPAAVTASPDAGASLDGGASLDAAAPPEDEGCEPIPGADPGFITIDTQPYSTLYWQGRMLGETPISRQKLPAGCVELEARTTGKDPIVRRVRVRVSSNKTLRYRFDLLLPQP